MLHGENILSRQLTVCIDSDYLSRNNNIPQWMTVALQLLLFAVWHKSNGDLRQCTVIYKIDSSWNV